MFFDGAKPTCPGLSWRDLQFHEPILKRGVTSRMPKHEGHGCGHALHPNPSLLGIRHFVTSVVAVDWSIASFPSGFGLLTVAVFLIFVPTAAFTWTTMLNSSGVVNLTEGAVHFTVLLANVQVGAVEHLPLMQTG